MGVHVTIPSRALELKYKMKEALWDDPEQDGSARF
jgi:hypothetical protein